MKLKKLGSKIQYWRMFIHSMIDAGPVFPHIEYKDWFAILLAFPMLMIGFTTWFGWGKVLIVYGILFTVCTASAYMTGLLGDEIQ